MMSWLTVEVRIVGVIHFLTPKELYIWMFLTAAKENRDYSLDPPFVSGFVLGWVLISLG